MELSSAAIAPGKPPREIERHECRQRARSFRLDPSRRKYLDGPPRDQSNLPNQRLTSVNIQSDKFLDVTAPYLARAPEARFKLSDFLVVGQFDA